MKFPDLPDLAALQAKNDAEIAQAKAEREQGRALATARHGEILLALDRIEAKLDEPLMKCSWRPCKSGLHGEHFVRAGELDGAFGDGGDLE